MWEVIRSAGEFPPHNEGCESQESQNKQSAYYAARNPAYIRLLSLVLGWLFDEVEAISEIEAVADEELIRLVI